MQAWMIQSNIEAFGHYEAALILKRKRVDFATAYALIFGRAPRLV